MDIERVNQLKIREDEVVHYNTIVGIAMVLEKICEVTGFLSETSWKFNGKDSC